MIDNARRLEGPSPDRGRCGIAAVVVRAGILLALFGMLVVRSAADEPLDAPLPDITPRELADKIRDAQRNYDRGLLDVTLEVEDHHHGPDGIPNDAMDPHAPIVPVRYSARFQFSSDGRRYRIVYDGQQIGASLELYPNRWTTGFDGETHYHLDLDQGSAALGDVRYGSTYYTPRMVFWPDSISLFEDLDDDPETRIGQRVVDGVRCYVVTNGDAKVGAEERVVSPRQSYLIVETTSITKGEFAASYRLLNIRRDARGLWVPGRIVEESRLCPAPLQLPPPLPDLDDILDIPERQPLPPDPPPLDERRTMKVVTYDPDKTFAPADFSFRVPYGAIVEDSRTGFAYVNDPWWPEVQGMLKERFADWFEWPIVDMSPLRGLMSSPEAAFPAQVAEVLRPGIIGKGAPPLRADLWINSGPMDWEKLKGKISLITFWSLESKWDIKRHGKELAALRKLYELYHPAGFEIIAVHENIGDAEAVRQCARELRLPYPIAIDSLAEGKTRTISAGFGDNNGYSDSFLVDGAGKVHAVPEGRLVETLVEMMKKAGAAGVSADMVQEYSLPPEALGYVIKTWHARVKDAKGDGRITGKVTDGRGQPLAGVPVRAMLSLKMLSIPYPGHCFTNDYPTPWTARTGPDGLFEIAGLCKGRYKLQVVARGRAAVDREVIIAPDLRPSPVDIVVDQPDGIVGFVRFGRSGWSMPFSLVFLRGRLQPDGIETWTMPFIRMAIANQWGGFRFDGLSSGKYNVLVIGPAGRAEKYIDVGNLDATIKLTPWWSATP